MEWLTALINSFWTVYAVAVLTTLLSIYLLFLVVYLYKKKERTWVDDMFDPRNTRCALPSPEQHALLQPKDAVINLEELMHL